MADRRTPSIRLSLLAVFLLTALLPARAVPQEATLELTEDFLNGLVRRLGTPSGAGTYQSPSGPETWRWSVGGARFDVAAGAMTFTATVSTRVGGQAATQTRTVPAAVVFEPSANRLRVALGAFVVSLQSGASVVTQVDVARLYGIAVPVEPQELSVPLLDGSTREIVARAAGVTPQYQQGKVSIAVDVGFASPAVAPHLLATPGAGLPPAVLDDTPLVPAGRSTVKIHEAMLNDLAGKLEPLRRTGHYKFEAGCACAPVVGCGCAVSVSCDYTVRVTDLRFRIRPTGIAVTGDVRASWCDLSFDAGLSTTADVRYLRAARPMLGPSRSVEAQDVIRVLVNPTSVQPRFTVAGYEAKLPVHINVAPSLSWRIPIGAGFFHYETASGPQRLRLSPSQMTLIKRNGYLEMQADVSLW